VQKSAGKPITASGKHDFARASAVISPGKGIVLLNSVPLDLLQPRIARDKILEALLLADDLSKKVDIIVRVKGGGFMGQAMASRLAIARALVKFSKSEKLKKTYIDYDRNLLVADVRKKETRKPGPSRARAGAQKSKR
jgi:small subunit ribosomal protein S9